MELLPVQKHSERNGKLSRRRILPSRRLHRDVCDGNTLAVKDFIASKTGVLTRETERERISRIHRRPSLDDRLNELDEDGRSPLHYAASLNREEILVSLLDAGATIDIVAVDGSTPLMNAISSNNIAIVKHLLKGRADLSVRNKYGLCAIHLAAERGTIQLFETVISNWTEDVNVTDNLGWTPLHFASFGGNAEICQLLIVSYKAKTDMLTSAGETAVHLSVASNNINVLKFLLSSCDGSTKSRMSFLNGQRNDRQTPLHIACHMGYEEITEFLINSQVSINLKTTQGKTPLHFSAASGHLNIVKMLIAADVNVNQEDAEGITPLHEACTMNRPHIVEFLVEKGAVLDSKDRDGHTPLICSVVYGNIGITMYIASSGGDLLAIDANLMNALHHAVQQANINIVKYLLEKQSSLVNMYDIHHRTALHYAAHNGNKDILSSLIEKCWKIDFLDDQGKTALHIAAEFGHADCVEVLIENMSAWMINSCDHNERTPLHLAAINGHLSVITLLCDAKSNLNPLDRFTWTPIFYCVKFKHQECLEYLVDSECEIVEKKGWQSTPLHVAVEYENTKAAAYLLEKNGNPLKYDFAGQTPLEYAIAFANKEICMLIIKHPRWRDTVMHACEKGHSIFDELVKKLPDVAECLLDASIVESGHAKDHTQYSITYYFHLLEAMPSSNNSEKEETGFFAPCTMITYKRESLLRHPVTKALLRAKWKAFGRYLYYISFLSYLMFSVSITSLIVIDRKNDLELREHKNETLPADDKLVMRGSSIHSTLVIFSIAFSVIQIFKEATQMIAIRWKYFESVTNLMEWTLYCATMAYMIDAVIPGHPFSESLRSHLGIICIFLSWINVTLFLQRVPLFKIYIVMFIQVLSSVVKILLVFGIVLLAFALTFNQLFIKMKPFETIPQAFLKTIVMTTGEFEFESFLVYNAELVDTESGYPLLPFPVLSKIVFVIFVVVVTITLQNLLIGAAVGDIAGIRKNASLRLMEQNVQFARDIDTTIPRFMKKWTSGNQLVEFPNRKNFIERLYARTQRHLYNESKIDKFLFNISEVKNEIDPVQESLHLIDTKLTKQEQQLSNLETELTAQSKILQLLVEERDHQLRK